MTTYRVQIVSTITADQSMTTTLYFEDLSGIVPAAAVGAEIASRVEAFYAEWSTYRQSNAWTGAHNLLGYNLEDPEPRLPVFSVPLTITSSAAFPTLDRRTQAVLSYRSEFESGVNRSRRRGRIFLGPLNINAGSTVNNANQRPGVAFRTAVTEAAQLLADEVAVPLVWMQRSETTGSVAPVVEVWMNDVFDTLRSRGPGETTRTVEPISQPL